MGGTKGSFSISHNGTSGAFAISCSFILLFVLLQVRLSFAQCTVAEGEPVSQMGSLPDKFELDCDVSLDEILAGDENCFDYLELLCIGNEEMHNVDAINDSLKFKYGEETETFRDALAKLGAAEDAHNKAVRAKNDSGAIFEWARYFREAAEYCELVPDNLCFYKYPILNESGYGSFKEGSLGWEMRASEASSDILKDEEKALEFSSSALNEVLAKLKSEASNLYCLGGGYENSDQAAAYSRVSGFIRVLNMQLEANGTDSDPARRWSNQYATLSKICASNLTALPPCATAGIINESLGNESIVFSAISLWHDAKEASQALLAGYQSIEVETSTRLNATNLELSMMKAEGYQNITSDDVRFFEYRNVSDEQKPSLLDIPTPAADMKKIDELLNGIGLEPGANQQYNSALTTYRLKDRFYAAKASEKLEIALVKIAAAERRINVTKQNVSVLLSVAEETVRNAEKNARLATSKYTATDATSIYLKDLADRRIVDADSILASLPSKTAGQKIKECRKAILLYEEAAAFVSKGGTQKEELLRDIAVLFEQFKAVNASAHADGIEVQPEETVYTTMVRLYENRNISDLEIIREGIENATATIYNKAELKYGYLSNRRAQISDELALLRFVDELGAQDLENRLSLYKDCIVDGRYEPQKTLGSYSKIDALFKEIDSGLSAKKPAALEGYLADNAKVTKVFPPEVNVDGKANVTYYIEITNDLRLSSNESLTVHIDGISAGPGASVTKPEGTYLRFGDGGIDILFSNIAAGPAASYSFRIIAESVIVESTATAEEVQQFDKSELRKRIDVTMTAAEAVTARYTEQLPLLTDECTAYVRGKEVPAQLTADGLTVTFTVRKGTNSFYAICKSYEPVAIVQHNQSVKVIDERRTQVEYYINVVSMIGDVEDFMAQISIIGNASEDSIKVYAPTGALADDFTFTRSATGYLVGWTVPFLTAEGKEYRAVYEVEDPARYLNDMENAIAVIAEAESIDVSSHLEKARHSTVLGRYDDALDDLQEAQRKIDAEKALRVEKSAATKRLDDIAARFGNLTYDSANFTALGWGEITLELDSKAREFSAKKKEIGDALAENKTSDAFRLLKDLEKISTTVNVGEILSKKVNKAFDDLSAVKKDFFTLNKAADMSKQIADIEILETKFTEISSAISESDYLRAATLTNEFNAGLEVIKERRDNETAAVADVLSATLGEINTYSAAWKKVRAKLVKALEISEDNPGPRFQQQKDEAEKMMADIDAAIGEANAFYEALKDAAKKQDVESMISNIDAIKAQKERLPELNVTIGLAEKAADGFGANAGAALEATKATISARAKGASKEELAKLETLAGFVNKAGRAFNDGNYLNSLAYTDYVQQQLSALEKKEGIAIDPMLIVAAVIAIAATIAALSIINMRKEKPEEPRALKRAE